MAEIPGLDRLSDDVEPIGLTFDPNRYRDTDPARESRTNATAMGLLAMQGGGKSRRRTGKLGKALENSLDPSFDHEVLYGPNVKGHANHLHFTADHGIKRIGRILQRKGFDVGEHPAFGGVAPVHTDGSHHYSANALDINYNGGGRWENEQQALGWLKRRIRQIYGDNAYYG